MDTSAALAFDLRILADALDPPKNDLDVQLRALISELTFASESFLGLAVTIVSGGAPFSILTLAVEDAPRIRSSALLPLASLCDVEPGSALILYATAAGSFAEFAIDVAARLELDPGTIQLDAHLVPPVRTSALTEIAGAQQVNQALGVLIERGFAPSAARVELRRLASSANTSEVVAASALVQGIDGRP